MHQNCFINKYRHNALTFLVPNGQLYEFVRKVCNSLIHFKKMNDLSFLETPKAVPDEAVGFNVGDKITSFMLPRVDNVRFAMKNVVLQV